MCGIKQPEEDAGKPKIIKETEINGLHGEAWSSRLLVRASSQPSPSLNGESDGYSLPFFTHSLCLHTYYATICLCGADRRSSDNLNVFRIYFAGSLGISREMEGLVSEVSIICGCEGQRSILAARTTAPPHTVSLLSLWMFFLFSFRLITSAVCVVVQFSACQLACAAAVQGVVNV